jgi:hypothetical protein
MTSMIRLRLPNWHEIVYGLCRERINPDQHVPPAVGLSGPNAAFPQLSRSDS